MGPFKDILPNRNKFLELQRQEYIRYEDLPLETFDGRLINVEFVSNIYEVDHTRVIQCNIRDITERMQAQETLKKSEERFKQIAELFPETIYEATLEGYITYANQQGFQMFGYSPEDIANGLNLINLILPDDRNRAIERVQNVISGDDKKYSEYQLLRKDGSIFQGLIVTGKIMSADGTPAGIRGLVIDIYRAQTCRRKTSCRGTAFPDSYRAVFRYYCSYK